MTQKITTNEVREKYLNHFKNKAKHVIVASSRLVPDNDPTTLFTGSGMQPMVPYLLGQKHPLGTRIVDSQKCFRSGDIEEVGDNRHTTFFEMLGNWSLGDYFKDEQITWMWEFLIEELKLDPTRLYFTCFEGDESLGVPRDNFSAEKWQTLLRSAGVESTINEKPEELGIQVNGEISDRVFYYNAKKNWWSRAGVPGNMPVGEPGGPDTEMFYDFEPDANNRNMHAKSQFKDTPCHVNCDCGRFMEIGNNVFMEYIKTDKRFEKLPAPNVDFGAGLERMAAAINNDSDMFRIDVFTKVIDTIEKLSGKKYNPIPDSNEFLGVDKMTQSIRVILDHMRAATFLIGDGILPGNKDQNYFVRRLLRRAVRNGKNLGIQNNFCSDVANTYIEIYKNHYTELQENKDKILQAIDDEETKFNKTLLNGEKEFYKILEGINKDNGRGYEEKYGRKHSIVARDHSILSGEMGFMLYESFGFPMEIIEDLCKENGIGFDKKGFEEARTKHQEMSRAGSEQKFKGGLADSSEIVVKYHTATHLLHEALKQVLGPDANQKGSNITSERLRFDFSHNAKMTPEEIKRTEDLVNKWIQEKIPVIREEVSQDEAISRGATHLFGEKYGDIVSIYTIGRTDSSPLQGEAGRGSRSKKDNPNIISIEFCGGPHVENTEVIGNFKISKEEAVSAGVRRIKAVIS